MSSVLMRTIPCNIAFLALVFITGCSVQQLAVRSMGGVFDQAMVAVKAEEDLIIAEQAIASDLKLLDGFLETDPKNEHILLLACEGYASYALAFASDSAERALLFYMRARDYGLRALRLRGIADSLFQGNLNSLRTALRKLPNDAIPIVFWTANSWGNAINLQRDNPEALAELPSVNAMMEWVISRDPTFFYGGPLLYFGVYYGSRPAILGGNLDSSKAYFDKAIAVSDGKFLMTLVFYAETYAVQVQDESLFRNLLTRVIEAPIDILPEQRLANAVAKARAKRLLVRMGDLF